jgi:hypothetical protein
MNRPTVILPGHPGQPRVELLDARIRGLEAPELRERTRALSPKRAAFISRSYRHPYALIARPCAGRDRHRTDRDLRTSLRPIDLHAR